MGTSFASMSPRQRMVNLMYLVFIALLALNVPPGTFEEDLWLDESLNRSVHEMRIWNETLRGRSLPDQLLCVSNKADSIDTYIEYLKEEIIHQASIKNKNNYKADTETVAQCMLAPVKGEAKKLRQLIEDYRQDLINCFPDELYLQELFQNILTTTTTGQKGLTRQEWENLLFENKPVGNTLPVLTKLQQDILWTEQIALSQYLCNSPATQFDHNLLQAYVLPEKPLLKTGEDFTGKIILGLQDSSIIQRIRLADQNKEYEGRNSFTIVSPPAGEHLVEGELEIVTGITEHHTFPFQTVYSVIQPVVHISSFHTNVLYAGYENNLLVTVSGLPVKIESVTINNGRIIKKTANHWSVIPEKLGMDAIISVYYSWNRKQYTGALPFRVVPLPEPSPFISCQTSTGYFSFKGGRINRNILLSAEVLEVGYDDDLLDADFEVLSFEISWNDSFGNRMMEKVNGKQITKRQKEIMKSFPKGKEFSFSGIRVQGGDKIIRNLPPLDVIVN